MTCEKCSVLQKFAPMAVGCSWGMGLHRGENKAGKGQICGCSENNDDEM
jgi:hypothetical protein